jgi:hypothetical protein
MVGTVPAEPPVKKRRVTGKTLPAKYENATSATPGSSYDNSLNIDQ